MPKNFGLKERILAKTASFSRRQSFCLFGVLAERNFLNSLYFCFRQKDKFFLSVEHKALQSDVKPKKCTDLAFKL